MRERGGREREEREREGREREREREREYSLNNFCLNTKLRNYSVLFREVQDLLTIPKLSG